MTDLQSARIFLANLHGAAVDDGGNHLVIWTLQDKVTRTFRSTDEAAEYAIERADTGCDVYHGLCPLIRPPKSGRGLETDVGVVCHVWLDLDVKSDAHKADVNYCPSIADGLAWLDQLDCKPSIIVHSGHGLQTYWMFKTPIRISNDDERAAAKAITIGWINHLKDRCQWALDPVGDLSRIFRIPGTINAKGGTVVPVQFVSRSWAQYEVTDLFAGNVPLPGPVVKAPVVAGAAPADAPTSDLYPSPDAGIPLAIMRMCEIDAKFKKTWLKRRKDLKSASEYDMSLCAQLLNGEASDQVIANALYSWRSIHSEDTEKLFRKPGPRGTLIRALIDKCRATMTHCKAFNDDLDTALQMSSELITETAYATGQLQETAAVAPQQQAPKQAAPTHTETQQQIDEADVHEEPVQTDDAHERQKKHVFGLIANKIGFELLDVIQMGRDEAIFNFVVKNSHGPAEVKIGTNADCLSPRACRHALFSHGILMPIIKEATWAPIIKAIMPFVKYRETNESRIDEYTHAIEEYLGSEGAVEWEDRLDAMNRCKPFIAKERDSVCVYLFDLLKYINTRMTLGHRVTKAQLGDGIAQVGFHLSTAEYNAGGIHKRMSYWYGPIGLLPERSTKKPHSRLPI